VKPALVGEGDGRDAALDLLGGDFEPVELREAQRLVGDGLSPDLWAALEAARAARAAKMMDRLARAWDPFALFGIPVPSKSRFGAAPTQKQLAVIGALRSPRRIQDAREADALVRELARREAAGLALYSQLALLARLAADGAAPVVTRSTAGGVAAYGGDAPDLAALEAMQSEADEEE
jgi:hypothetical protein